jgi:hypothetical protein
MELPAYASLFLLAQGQRSRDSAVGGTISNAASRILREDIQGSSDEMLKDEEQQSLWTLVSEPRTQVPVPSQFQDGMRS